MFDEKLLKKPIYKQAFTHRSYLNESNTKEGSNERLEFLGDAVLSFITSSYLYEERVFDNEGDLTNLRSYIVKTESLSKAAKSLNLGKFLRLSKGEELTGGRENIQLLANTYEALLGAIYLDQGLKEASEFVYKTLIPYFQKEINSGPPKDAKSRLQELAQEITKQSPKYKIIKTSGPDHAKKFSVGVYLQGKLIGQGEGMSKQVAEEKAALMGLEGLTQS